MAEQLHCSFVHIFEEYSTMAHSFRVSSSCSCINKTPTSKALASQSTMNYHSWLGNANIGGTASRTFNSAKALTYSSVRAGQSTRAFSRSIELRGRAIYEYFPLDIVRRCTRGEMFSPALCSPSIRTHERRAMPSPDEKLQGSQGDLRCPRYPTSFRNI